MKPGLQLNLFIIKTTVITALAIIYPLLCKAQYNGNNNKITDHNFEIGFNIGQNQDNLYYGINVANFHFKNAKISPILSLELPGNGYNVRIGFTNHNSYPFRNTSFLFIDGGMYFTSHEIDDYSFYLGQLQYGIYVYGGFNYYVFNKLPVSIKLGVTCLNEINLSYNIGLSYVF